MNQNPHHSNSRDFDDPRLTAYALGQAEESDEAEVERWLAEADAAKAEEIDRTVQQIRRLSEGLVEAARCDPLPPPSSALREAIDQRLADRGADSRLSPNAAEREPAASSGQLEAVDSPVTVEPPTPRRRGLGRRRWLALAAAVCLLAAVVPAAFWITFSVPLAQDAHVAFQSGDPVVKSWAEASSSPAAGAPADALVLAPRENEPASTQSEPDGDTYRFGYAKAVDALKGETVDRAERRTSRAHPSLEREVRMQVAAGESAEQVVSDSERNAAGTFYASDRDKTVLYSAFGGGEKGEGLSRSPRLAGKALPAGVDLAPTPTKPAEPQVPASAAGVAGMGGGRGRGYAQPMAEPAAPADAPAEKGQASDLYAVGQPPPSSPAAAPVRLLLEAKSAEAAPARGAVVSGDGATAAERQAREQPSGASNLALGYGSDARVLGVVEEEEQQGQSFGRMAGPSAPGTEQYDEIIENDFLSAVDEPLSTFSIDVDTASYANVRRFLVSGSWPPPDAVRIEELVNYFPYDYPDPGGEHPFSVNMEVAQCPWNPAHRLVRVGLKGQEIHRKERGPSNLVFLLDVSGSMSDRNKLPLVKEGMRMLADQLGEDDRVAIVTYAGNAGLALESTNAADKQKIVGAIEALRASGSTHGSAGIQMAYDQATRHFVDGGTNRVLLATDGDLNVGVTDDDQLVELIRQKAATGVFLTVLGFGTGNLKDAKLEKLADHGNGTYAYVDSLREAHKVLVHQATGSLVTIAKDVKIQIEFNPAEVKNYRLIGYENRLLAARDFADDSKDAGEIGAGHTVTALYEVVPAGAASDIGMLAAADRTVDREEGAELLRYQLPSKPELTEQARSGELLTLRLRYKEPQGETSRLIEHALRDEGKRFGQASADFRFAASVAAFGMVLRGSPHATGLGLAAVEEFAAGALGPDSNGYRGEFVGLVRHATAMLAASASGPPAAARVLLDSAGPAGSVQAVEPSLPSQPVRSP